MEIRTKRMQVFTGLVAEENLGESSGWETRSQLSEFFYISGGAFQ